MAKNKRSAGGGEMPQRTTLVELKDDGQAPIFFANVMGCSRVGPEVQLDLGLVNLREIATFSEELKKNPEARKDSFEARVMATAVLTGECFIQAWPTLKRIHADLLEHFPHLKKVADSVEK